MSKSSPTSETDFELVPPDPAALIESLRAFGYTPASALADLIDNSITAGATTVAITFHWGGAASWIEIVDDGEGMGEAELVSAMRAGSTNPRLERHKRDLGRFGLGLKTASFSQARVMTVVSKPLGGRESLRRWDLDEVARSGEWRLLKPPPTSSAALRLRASARGTAVVWESLDRIVSGGQTEPSDEHAQEHFFAVADLVSAHLSMTFHRFLNDGSLTITVNDQPIRKWDPFLTDNPARQEFGHERLDVGEGVVEIWPYVLPHRSKLTDNEYELGGGVRGWNDLQGFYVYRNRRLLLGGDWLGLRLTKEEHYKLARIRIDISNDLDEAWQIDVRKSTAVPPAEIRPALARIAKFTRERAVEVYRHRGKAITRQSDSGVTPLWTEKVRHGRISYEVNRDHPVVMLALDEPSKSHVRSLLRLVEESVPVPLIAINAAERNEAHSRPLETATPAAVRELAVELFLALRRFGETRHEAVRRVLTTDPFHLYPELAETLEAQLTQIEETP